MATQSPLVSVLMPNYNGSGYLKAAIESILEQSYQHFEFVIVDDCSTDNSWEIIKEYADRDERIIPIRNEENSGVARSLNHGLQFCKGEWVARMDSDDISHHDRLLNQLDFLHSTDSDVCGCAMTIIDENGVKSGVRHYPAHVDSKEISLESPVAHPTVVFRTDLLHKSGSYNEIFESAEDYELWLRFFRDGAKFVNCNERLYLYRIHSLQVKNLNTKKQLRTTIKVKKLAKNEYGIHFPFTSHMRLLGEQLLTFLPQRLIYKLFRLIKY